MPPVPALTKKGTLRKRNRFLQPGRLFFEDGRELPLVARLSIEGGPVSVCADDISSGKKPKYMMLKLHLDIDDPDVEIIKQAPAPRVL